MKIEGRVVAVTGAASGIGAAMAEEAARRGAKAIAVIDVNADGAEATARRITDRGVPATAFTCDISDVDAVERLAAEVEESLGTPGMVCANAGVSTEAAPLLDAEAGDLAWAMSVNVTGTWATLKAFGNRMVAAKDPGWLLVTASEHAIGIPFPGNGFYTLTKHAVLGLTDVLRRELPDHVGISTMIPGLASTGLWRSATLRPDKFGGASPANDLAHAVLARGMDPGVVASLALDGVTAERFLIATHPHAKGYADERTKDVAEAFDALAAAGADSTSYDVMEIVAELASAAEAADQH